MTRLPERNLDVLRAVAVLLVLVDHLLTIWDVYPQVVTRWELGRLGVLLFFVHTSLVLMSSLEREGGASGWVRAFYVRRADRKSTRLNSSHPSISYAVFCLKK